MPRERLHKHHFTNRRNGGSDESKNLRLVHSECHRQQHANDGGKQTAEPVKPLGLLEPRCLETSLPGSEGAGHGNVTRLPDQWRGLAMRTD
ncbi:HNH endonuclease [Streptomyces inhibens]|uniref:HNH endonuclease n=1 Tax=Streptomyces inhibens TaxID=2293571 RepID=UPI003693B24F